jgi:hypothetical protein
MIPVYLDYASPSALESDRDRADLRLAASRRRPVRFHGRVVRELFHLRVALRALGEAIWSDDGWLSDGEAWTLDPVITLHPDRIFFEAFSQDQSAYVLLNLDPAIFEPLGETLTGTTHVDFSAWLWGALGELRSSRATEFRIESGGFEVKTEGAGGRYERRSDLPEPWVRGFLNLQAAMALPGTRLTVRPVDLLAALRWLRHAKAKVSPRALRYEFEPGRDAELVLEPWERRVPLVGAGHGYAERRAIRTWGRRRLRLLEPLLPFAERVDITLKGRALPSFYAARLPGMTFVLGLSGWTGQPWSEAGGFDLLGDSERAVEPEQLDAALALLAARWTLNAEELAEARGLALAEASRLLQRLCRLGRAVYDLEARRFRHRELFEAPIAEERLYPPDPRREQAAEFLARGQVAVERCEPEEQRKARRFRDPNTGEPIVREVIYRNWRAAGRVGDRAEVQAVINDEGRIVFGVCSCPFFAENLLNQGPCAHIAALCRASEPLRADLPVSRPAEAPPPGREEDEADDGGLDEEADEGE